MDLTPEFSHLIDKLIHSTQVKEIESILVTIFDINDCDENHHTPIYYAATMNASTEILNVLLLSGSRVDFPLLCEAVIHTCNPEIAKILYNNLAPLNHDDLNYLFLLVSSNRTDFSLLHYFLQEGATIDATIGMDLYPDWEDGFSLEEENNFIMVEQNALILALYENPAPLKMIKELLRIGVDVDYSDSLGNSVISHALDDIDLIKILIESGANIHKTDALGKTPLMCACEGENIDVALYLISVDDEINNVSNEKKTALHYALSCHLTNNFEVVKALIRKGADLTIEDGEGDTPLMVALSHFAYGEIIYLIENALIS